MTYVVIDTDGALHIRDQSPTVEAIRAEVGDWDMVRLGYRGQFAIRGWVSDTGLIDGHTPRNVVGSVLVMCCNGPQQPYAGPIVVTGWDEYAEVVPLAPDWLMSLQELHQCIGDALAGDDGCTRCGPAWRQDVRNAAEMVRDAPTPAIRVISLDDELVRP